jgi:hypothetical protein
MSPGAVAPVARPTLQLPNAPGFDWTRLQSAWVDGDPFQPSEAVRDYYATKAAIAAWLQPDSVVEIGVRAGYSALAFYLGHPYSWYQGYDADRGDWGGLKGYCRFAEESLGQLPRLYRWEIEIADSQRLAALREPVGGIDMAHVDGDHGWAGAVHDITLCLNAGARYVVLDDYAFVPAVRAAGEDVVTERGLTGVYIADALGRGNLILANHGVEFPDVI